MSKRNKQKSKQKSAGHRVYQGFFRPRQPDPTYIAAQARTLLESGKADEALDLLEPLLDEYPRSADLFGTAAMAYLYVGDPWSAIFCFEQVQKIQPAPVVWATLAGVYLQVGLRSYAAQAIRHALKGMNAPEDRAALQVMLAPLEDEFNQLVQRLGIPAKQVETGLRHHDDAQRAMSQFDLQAAIDANRRAIRFLGNWPPVHNNLAQALFFSGQPAEAIATTQKVLADAPDNLHALSNGVKFLAWSGKSTDARALWDRLRALEPQDELDRFKQAEAAAVLEEDESVYQILNPLVKEALGVGSALAWEIVYFFAVAEANTGRTKAAVKHLQSLDSDDPRVQTILDALKAKRPGIGWSARYPYFTLNDIMALEKFEEAATLLAQQGESGKDQRHRQVQGFLQRYPQLLLIGKKLIWEEMQPDFGIAVLGMIGTPEAHALLLDYGLSQAGSDQDRMAALIYLKEVGVLNADEPVRVWSEGEWREVKVLAYEISDEPDVVYSPKAIKIYERAIAAFHREEFTEAEKLLKQVIALEPDAADAYFNLGAAYAGQGKVEQAQQMCYKAIELRPLYAMPRCHLAQNFLDDDDIEKAKDILMPLANATRFSTMEASMYMFIQARLLIAEEDYEKARDLLESLLEVAPDFEPAQRLLSNVQLLATFEGGMNRFWANMARRQEQRRAVMQTKLKTIDVTVDMALSVFNREVQRSMARHILSGGGWSALKKKELHGYLAAQLLEPDTLKHMIDNLDPDERTALRAVVRSSGVMAWDDFDQQYGNDLDENPDWQYEEPTTIMGRLRQRALLSIATVGKRTVVVVPVELRKALEQLL